MKWFHIALVTASFWSYQLQAQISVQVKWGLDSVTTVTAVITGNAAAGDEELSNLFIESYKGVNGSQRVSPIAGGGWPVESALSSSRYAQFAVRPLPGMALYVTGLSLFVGSTGGNNMWAIVRYSTDSTFASSTTIFNANIAKGAIVQATAAPNVYLTTGQMLYVRAYPWYSGGSASGKYFCLKDVNVTGSSALIGQPILSTSAVSNILTTTATCGGTIHFDGGNAVTARGVCWSTSANPTIADAKTIDSSGTGSFVSSLTDLTSGMEYHVRAYATNSSGTFYGDDVAFTTVASGVQYALQLSTAGNGTIIPQPVATAYNPGAVVTITAVPDSGYSFLSWSGDLAGRQNPAQVTMNAAKIITAKFIRSSLLLADKAPIGFAAAPGQGVSTTTGGAGGDTVFCPKGADVLTYLTTTPRTVIVTDTVICSQIKGINNFSIIGRGEHASLQGMALSNCINVIVRNLTVFDSPDGISITTTSSSSSHHIWIDHCSFTDDPAIDTTGTSHDGVMDVTHRSSYVTISWCRFWNHRKTCLLGYSSSGGSGETELNQLMVTYHHNFFDGTFSRHPRARWAPVHVYNNYYRNNNYGVGSTCGARVYVENNYFENVGVPVLISQYNDPTEILSGDPLGFARSVSNYSTIGAVADNSDSTFNFDPHSVYSYTPDAAADIPELTRALSGAGVLEIPSAGSQSVGIWEHSSTLLPRNVSLGQNYPNPFNPTTVIRYQISVVSVVDLRVYDLLGREVAVLATGEREVGTHSVGFDASLLSSGFYFYRLVAGGSMHTKMMLLTK